MDNILLCTGFMPRVTYIDNAFIEKYMLGANGSYVKVYLYLAKCIQENTSSLTISYLADKMENTEKDVIRALNYWEKSGIIRINRNEDKSVTGIAFLNPEPDSKEPVMSQPAAATPPVSETENVVSETQETPVSAATVKAEPVMDVPSVKNISAATKEALEPPKEKEAVSFRVSPEQLKKLAANEEFVMTMRVVESFLKRPLKPGEQQLVSYLYDTLHFSMDLIMYLYEYCIELGKTSQNYVQSVALSWDEKNVKTPEDAKLANADYNTSFRAVSKAFALGRSLATAEKDYVQKWQKDWKLDLGVIIEACNRTVIKLQHADFKYTDGILQRWYKEGTRTLQDVAQADKNYEEKKQAKREAFHRAEVRESEKKNGTRNRYAPYSGRKLSQNEADELEKKLLNMN